MKGQQIFHSFLPGVTAAVLTTQPAWAQTAKFGGVQQLIPSDVSAATVNGTKPETNKVNINTQQLSADSNDIGVIATGTIIGSRIGFEAVGVTSEPVADVGGKFSHPASYRTIATTPPVSIPALHNSNTAKESIMIPVPQVKQKLAPEPKTTSKASRKDSERSKIGQKLRDAIARQQSKSAVIANPSSQVKSIPEKSQNSVLSQNFVSGAGAAKLLEVQSCSLACPPAKFQKKLVSQQPEPTPTTPAPVIPTIPVKPTTPTAPQTQEQIPDYLNPNSNPLQFPTRPEEVRSVGTQPITLEQAIELARRNNRQLQISLLELERAQAALREAQADLFPTLDLSAQVVRQQSAGSQLSAEARARAEEGLPPELRTPSQDDTTTSFTGDAQLVYNVYTAGRRQANINANEEQVRFQELEVESLAEEIRLNVATTYYNLQQADENVRIAQSAVVNAEASLRDAQALERAGVGTRFDVLRAQVNLANSQQQLTNALSQQRIRRSELASILSTPVSVNLTTADPVRLAGLWNPTLEESIVLAFQNRPELQQFLAQRNISEQRRRQFLAERGPQLSLVASYNLLDQFDDSISVTDGYSLGVRASLNLFDGGAARARAAQQTANIRIAETQFAQQRNQIRSEVEQAYSQLQANLENVQTANAALEQAREALRLARLRFQAGVGTQTDVIAAENDLTQAEGNRVQAILEYNRALANLQRFVTSRGLS